MLAMQLNGRRPEKYRQNLKIDAPELAVSFRAAMAAAMQPAVNPNSAGNGHDTTNRSPAH